MRRITLYKRARQTAINSSRSQEAGKAMCQSLTNTCKSAKGEKYCKKQLSQASAEPCSAAKPQNSAHSQLASTNKMPAASAISPFFVQNTINTKQAVNAAAMAIPDTNSPAKSAKSTAAQASTEKTKTTTLCAR